MTTQPDSFIPLLEKGFWQNNENPIWLASTFKLHRNISKYFYPSKLELNKQQQLFDLTSKALLAQLKEGLCLKGEAVSAVGKQFLFEHFLASESFHEARGGEGFIIDPQGRFLILINMRDHLQLQALDCKGEIEGVWNQLVAIETEVGKTLSYAFLPRFGFLTSNPHHCGTGFILSVYLHLPAIIHLNQLPSLLEKEKENNVSARGMQGDLSDLIGDVVVFHNKSTIGISEEEIVRTMRSVATRFLVAEQGVRAQLKSQEDPTIKNKVSRAYGLAFHSYELETPEALNSLSMCKLGIDLGWIEGLDHKTLNALFFNGRRAHLLGAFPALKQEELAHKRAELIHQAFESSKLLI